MPRRESSSRRDRGRRSRGSDRRSSRRDRGRRDDTSDYDRDQGGAYGGDAMGGGGGGLVAASEGLLQNQASAAPPGQQRPHVDFTPLRTKLVVWNAVLLVLGITLLAEGLYLMHEAYLGYDGSTLSDAAAAQADTEGGLGGTVLVAGLLVFILAATQYTQCCHAECCAQMSYIIWSMFLVIYELGVSFAVIAVANWDKVQAKLAEDPDMKGHLDKIKLAVPAYSESAKTNLYVVVGVLVVSGLMQIGAVLLHVKRRTELANWFIMDVDDQTGGDDSGSYGSGSAKNNNRLAELRDYYAQLYAEHGLSVPSELRNPHPV